MTKYAGAEWIVEALKISDMSALGVAVADLLGDVFLGIYHLPNGALLKVDWRDSRYMEINLREQFSTIDNDLLTRLVVLAHDRMIRVSMCGIAPRYMQLQFQRRHSRDGDLWERCPTLEDHAKALRAHYAETNR